jgi:hypothetical protein
MRDVTSASIICAKCSYDLRGTAPDAVCPECGLAWAESSAFWAIIAGTSRPWRRAVAAGLCLVLLGILLTPAMVLDDPLRELWRKGFGIDLMNAYFINELIEVGIVLLLIVGIWLITRRPDASTKQRRPTLALRGLSLLLLALPVMEHLARAYLMRVGFGDPWYVWLMSIASVGGFALISMIAALLAWQLRQLATGFGAASLSRHSRIIQWAWTILPLTMFAMMGLSYAIESFTGLNQRIDQVFTILAMGVFLGLVAAAGWGLMVIVRLTLLTLRLHRRLVPVAGATATMPVAET